MYFPVVCGFQEAVFEEQKRVCGVTGDSQWPPLDYDTLKDLQLLDRCLKETLRLRPPIMTMMRMCKTPQVGHRIPHCRSQKNCCERL